MGIFGFVKYKLYSVENKTYSHLLEEYDENEILKVDSHFSKGRLFVATVVFKDEDNVVYEYAEEDGALIQVDPDPDIGNYKHIEK